MIDWVELDGVARGVTQHFEFVVLGKPGRQYVEARFCTKKYVSLDEAKAAAERVARMLEEE